MADRADPEDTEGVAAEEVRVAAALQAARADPTATMAAAVGTVLKAGEDSSRLHTIPQPHNTWG